MTDYSEIGLKVGLEVHQQLDTAAKLFCNCETKLFKGEPEVQFLRRLRPTQSELGQIDVAAFFEFQKGMKIVYEADRVTSCLVEMDEEPPHELNSEAVDAALTVASMMDATPVDEIHVMRKTVIDGSNTTGFQRTCVVAFGGCISTSKREIPLQHIDLEEDAARKMGQSDSTIRYRIDRLGIPLIEVATTPTIHSPEEAKEAALAIGQILRGMGRVKRGLGSIRQDLNISLREGALVEIKGVQELELISTVVEHEVQRQLRIIEIRDQLTKRGLTEDGIIKNFVDVTDVFKKTGCHVISNSIRKGGVAVAVVLPSFAGMLSKELAPGVSFGKELADRARFWGRVGGLFHTDELPAYGISEREVAELRSTLKAGGEDAVIVVSDSKEKAYDALEAVTERAVEALKGVPSETRAANPDGTTYYMRPRPGSARMYPETDVPPLQITDSLLRRIKKNLPEPLDKKLKRLMEEYRLNNKLAKQILNSPHCDLLEESVRETKVCATTIAVFLTEQMKALKREGVKLENVPQTKLKSLFKFLGERKIAKEAVEEVFRWLSKNVEASVDEAVEQLGLKMMTEEELEVLVNNVLTKYQNLVKTRGEKAFGPLMGTVMERARGKAKAEAVAELLKAKLKEHESKF